MPFYRNRHPTRCWFSKEIENVPVRSLAIILHQKPFQVVADLLRLGILVNADDEVDLEIACKLLRQHGFTVDGEG